MCGGGGGGEGRGGRGDGVDRCNWVKVGWQLAGPECDTEAMISLPRKFGQCFAV